MIILVNGFVELNWLLVMFVSAKSLDALFKDIKRIVEGKMLE